MLSNQHPLLFIIPEMTYMIKKNYINSIGFYSGLMAFVFTVSYCIIQLLQVVRYFRYPLDEILIYSSSLCIVVPFVLAMLSFHYVTSDNKKFWSHAALIFAILYAVFVTANYVVQLATVIPMTLKGNARDIQVLIQTPHSLFWDFDALGYIFMGFATLFAVPALDKNGFEKWVRYAFIANAIVTPMIAFVYFYPDYSERLLIIGYPWAITAPLSMLALAISFKKRMYAN
jgi:hypothetical protein